MPPSSQFPGPGRPSRTQVYQRLDDAIAELDTRLGGLPTPAEAQSTWDDTWVQKAHDSTAIEGNTLVLRQVQELLQRDGRWATSSSPSTWSCRGAPTQRLGPPGAALELPRRSRQLLALH